MTYSLFVFTLARRDGQSSQISSTTQVIDGFGSAASAKIAGAKILDEMNQVDRTFAVVSASCVVIEKY